MNAEQYIKNKTCSKCKTEKPVSEFHRDRSKSDGLHSQCKACQHETAAIYRKNNRKKIRSKFRKYYNENKEKWLNNNKKKWKKTGYSKNLDKVFGTGAAEYRRNKYIEQKGFCPICGKHETELTYRLAFDHNHRTNEWRGLLCSNCNLRFGWFENNKEAILNYIKKYS